MIKDEEMRRGGPEEEMVRLAHLGKIETILCHKESIDLHNLFHFPPTFQQPLVVRIPPPPPGRVCLIEGAPGGGKSTLALHICHQWVQGASWLARFDIVVLAYLRDQAIQNASTLADILPARTSDGSQSVASQLKATDGKNVLFIFDGWDEFPPKLMNDSVITKIIKQPGKISLHQSTIIVTSRPVATGNLLHIADRRVEILGFTQIQIHDYIAKALNGNSTRIQKLVQHLEEHPVIKGYCYIPLHSAILVHIFLTMKGALPTTLHELFCDLVLCCIVREHETHEPNTILPELSSLDDLPDDLKSKLSNLSILAYNGVMLGKIVFYSKDLQESHLPADLSSLGLLQAVEGLTKFSKTRSYNFLHLSVQELLAAYQISQMDPSEQVKVFKELFERYRFRAVLRYYCGFSKLDNPEIQKFIASCQTEISTLRELLPLLHCFFEAQQPSLCQLVHPSFIYSNDSECCGEINGDILPVNYLAIGYFITSVLSTFNALTVHLSIDDIDDHCLKLLLSQLSKYPVAGGVPHASETFRLSLYKPSMAAREAKLLASHLKQSSSAINELTLCNHGNLINSISRRSSTLDSEIIQSDNDALLHITEALQTNSSLTKLTICCTNLKRTVKIDFALTKMLQVNKSLTHLDLSYNKKLSDSGAQCIFKGLQHNTALVSLNLSSTGITATDPDTVTSLAIMLQRNNSLKHIDLSRNYISKSANNCIFEALQHNSSLINLILWYQFVKADSDTARSFYKMIQVNSSLTHLDVGCSGFSIYCTFQALQHNTTLVNLNVSSACYMKDMDPDTARSLSKMLRENKSLTHLDLSVRCTLSDGSSIFEGLQHNTTLVNLKFRGIYIDPDNTAKCMSLANMLQENKSITHLDLSCNDLSDSNIFEGLQHNTSLVNLNLSHARIYTATDDPDTARSLTKMLQVNKSLTHLDLSHNSLSDSCILEGLQHNTTLVELDISDTDISTRCISQVLKHNTTLLHLVLRGIVITDNDAELLAQALKSNHTLQTLNIVRIAETLSDNGACLILDSLKFTTTFKKLYLTYSQLNKIMKHIENINKARMDQTLPPIRIETKKVRDWESEHYPIKEMQVDSYEVTFVSVRETDSAQLQTEGKMLWILHNRKIF